MDELSSLLSAHELQILQAHYRGDDLLALRVEATSAAYPAHTPWITAVRDTFFGKSALSEKQRELCLVALLGFRAPALSLATHVYAALMEGASVAEICEAAGLSGCYGGLPTYTDAMATVRKTIGVLKKMSKEPEPLATAVVLALASAFSFQVPGQESEC